MPKVVPRQTAEEWFAAQCDVTEILDELHITESDLEIIIMNQPDVLRKAGAYRIQQMQNRNIAKVKLEMARSDRQLRIRNDSRLAGDKVTEGHITALMTIDKTLQPLEAAYLLAQEREEASILLLEAVRSRGWAAKTMVDYLSVQVAFGGKQLADTQESRRHRELAEKVREKFTQ